MCIGSVTTVRSAAPNSAAPAILLDCFSRRASICQLRFCRRRMGEGQLVIALSRSPSFPGPSPGGMNKKSDQLILLYISIVWSITAAGCGSHRGGRMPQ